MIVNTVLLECICVKCSISMFTTSIVTVLLEYINLMTIALD